MTSAPLPDEALVVRGGIVTPEGTQHGADEHPEGPWGISVQSAPRMTAEQLARAGRIPHGKICVTTVGRVHALGPGFDVVPTRGVGRHATLAIPSRPVSPQHARMVNGAFDPPVSNPARRQEHA